MVLMSWGGGKANKVKRLRNLDTEIERFKDELQRLGIRHNHTVSDNILWNDEVKRIMFIDFGAATETRMSVL